MNKKNNSKIGYSAAILSASNIFTMAVGMLSAMLLSRFFTKFEYGTYSQIMLATTLIISIFTFGFPNSINYYFAKCTNKEEKQDFLSTYFLGVSVLCILAGIFLVIISPYLKVYFNNDTISDFSFALLIIPLTRVIIQSNSNILIAIGNSLELIIYQVLYNALLLFIIIITKIIGLNLKNYILLFVMLQLIFSIYVYIRAFSIGEYNNLRSVFISKSTYKLMLKKIIVFSLPIGIGSIVSTFSLELSKLIITNLMGTTSLAIYTNASKELPVVMIVSSFTSVLMPKLSKMISENKKNEAFDLWFKTINIGYSIMLFFAISIITFAPQALVFLYSEKYLDGLQVFSICTSILILRSTYFGIMLNISGKTKFILYSSIISLIFNIIFTYLFYNIFGFIGPALSTLVSVLFVNAIQLLYTSKVFKIPFKYIFPWKSIFINTIKIFTISIPFIIISKIIKLGTTTKDVIFSFIIGTIWFIVYILFNKKILLNNWNKINEYKL